MNMRLWQGLILLGMLVAQPGWAVETLFLGIQDYNRTLRRPFNPCQKAPVRSSRNELPSDRPESDQGHKYLGSGLPSCKIRRV